jgi:hypothetical protein
MVVQMAADSVSTSRGISRFGGLPFSVENAFGEDPDRYDNSGDC